jgi:hypothetical protein
VVNHQLDPRLVIVATSGCAEALALTACTLGTVLGDEVRQYVVTARIPPGLQGTYPMDAQVSSATPDPDLSDNEWTEPTDLGEADLTLEVEGPLGTPVLGDPSVGERVYYSLTVTNVGPQTATSVVLVVEPSSGGVLSSAGCERGATLRCLLGDLEVGEEVVVEVFLDVGLTVANEVQLVARVDSELGDPNPGDNASGERLAVTPPEELQLHDGRFAVYVDWRDVRTGSSGTGEALMFSGTSGFFYFFDEDNLEVVVNVLDGTGFNGHFWFFYAGLTDLEYDLTVVDRVTGLERTYHQEAGDLCGQADIRAFPVSSVSVPFAPPLSTKNRTPLSLKGGRFEVEVRYRVPQRDEEGLGQPMAVTDDTGVFSFFHPEIPDLAVKIVDGRAFNGKFWFFTGSLSNVEFEITVTDTETGATRTYFNAAGELCGLADTGAF